MTKSELPLISVGTEDLRLLMETGYLYFHMNRHEEAREVFEGVVQLAPKSEVPHIALALLHFGQGRPEEAEKEFKKGLELQPKSANGWANYGDFLYFYHRNEEAMDALNRANELDPNGPDGILARSIIETYKPTSS